MKFSFLLLLFSTVCTFFCYSQNSVHHFEIRAKSVKGEIYPIEVLLPDGYDSSRTYPVVYVTDWWYHLNNDQQIFNLIQRNNKYNPIILVGIGTIGNENDWILERRRDLTPTYLPDQDRYESVNNRTRGVKRGANNFLKFIKNELIPYIESQYPSDSSNRGYVGYSLGGLFGSYILSSDPQLFKKYLLGSPTLKYDDYLMIERLKKTSPDNLMEIKSIFVSVGEYDEGDYLKGFADFRDLILRMNIPDLKFKSIIIEGEGHMSAIPHTITKGLSFLYAEE